MNSDRDILATAEAHSDIAEHLIAVNGLLVQIL